MDSYYSAVNAGGLPIARMTAEQVTAAEVETYASRGEKSDGAHLSSGCFFNSEFAFS